MIAERQLLALQDRYAHVRIDKYVIMPTHIHAIIRLVGEVSEGKKRPAIPDIICAYKSLTTKICNEQFDTPGMKLFQTSFYDSVLQNERAYLECWQYIDENPLKWILDPEDL